MKTRFERIFLASAGLRRAQATFRAVVKRNDLVSMFGSLAATQVATSTVGLAYWAVAARLLPAKQVGLAAAATSAMSLLSIFAMLGIGTMLISELPRRRVLEQPALFGTGLLTVLGAGAVLGVCATFIGPHLAPSLASTGGSELASAAFAVGVAVTAAGVVFDQAVLGLRRGPVQFLRNAVASGLKLALLVAVALMGWRSAEAMVTTWVFSLCVSIGVALLFLHLSALGPLRVGNAERLRDARRQFRDARQHYGLNLALEGSGYMLPVVVSLITQPREVAYFSTARLISGAVLTIPFMLTVALFASTAGQESRLGERVRQSVPLGLALSLISAAITAVIAEPVMHIFGAEYARHGANVLRLLTLAGPLLVVKDHLIAIRRVQGQLASAARFAVGATVLEIGASWAGGVLFGLMGVCMGWLIALAIEAAGVAHVVLAVARMGTRERTTSAGD